jgi:hypothetical protein
MLDYNKIKLLDSYQLFQLIHSESLDKNTLTSLNKEFHSRNLSEDEKIRLKNKFRLNHSKFESELDKNNWNPIFTPFLLNYPFHHLGLLKTHGRKKEAKIYMIELYIGLTIYFIFLVVLIFILESK